MSKRDEVVAAFPCLSLREALLNPHASHKISEYFCDKILQILRKTQAKLRQRGMKPTFLFVCIVGTSLLFSGQAADRARLGALVRDLETKPKSMAEFEQLATEARKEYMPEFDIAALALENAIALRDFDYLEKNFEALNRTLAAAPKEKVPAYYLVYRELGRAILASRQSDRKTEEAAFKQAFWIAPDWGGTIGKIVEEVLADERLREVRVPMNEPMLEGPDGPATLAQLVADKSFTLVYFWMGGREISRRRLTDFAKITEAAKKEGVGSLMVNISFDSRKEAALFAREKAPDVPAYDMDKTETLPRLLDIKVVPAVALISSSGAVLFVKYPPNLSLLGIMDQISRYKTEPAHTTGE